MRASILLLLSAASHGLAAVLEPRGTCNANNCNRAVSGTQKGINFPATASSDCAAFQTVTFISTSMTTTTSTAPVSTTSVIINAGSFIVADPNGPFGKRSVASATGTHASQPTYASACTTASAYATACSCLGITAGSTTITTTIIATSIVAGPVATVTTLSGAFTLSYKVGNQDKVAIYTSDGSGIEGILTGAPVGEAVPALCGLDSTNRLLCANLSANVEGNNPVVYLSNKNRQDVLGLVPIRCTIDTGVLVCQPANDLVGFYDCNNYIFYEPAGFSDCTAITLTVNKVL